MSITKSVLELIGNTPILDASHLAPRGSANVYVKLEMSNPGGSIKDRPALAMITAAEETGQLKPGMTIVEPTAGNTGIGLALVGNLKGYKTAFFVPDRMSQEKISAMRLYGAQVFLIPKDEGIQGCISAAEAYAEEHGNCYIPNQFTNPSNPAQAEQILGPEIGNQLGAVPDGIAIGAGTGGTFTGIARWVKNHKPEAQCWVVQPVGSVFKGGEKGTYQIEGIGNSFVPETLDLDLADNVYDVADERAFYRCRQAGRELGLLIGGSSGANLEAAIALAVQLGKGKSVVTIFPDTIERYMSKDWVQTLANQ